MCAKVCGTINHAFYQPAHIGAGNNIFIRKTETKKRLIMLLHLLESTLLAVAHRMRHISDRTNPLPAIPYRLVARRDDLLINCASATLKSTYLFWI